jgi:hypothetical protein
MAVGLLPVRWNSVVFRNRHSGGSAAILAAMAGKMRALKSGGLAQTDDLCSLRLSSVCERAIASICLSLRGTADPTLPGFVLYCTQEITKS